MTRAEMIEAGARALCAKITDRFVPNWWDELDHKPKGKMIKDGYRDHVRAVLDGIFGKEKSP